MQVTQLASGELVLWASEDNEVVSTELIYIRMHWEMEQQVIAMRCTQYLRLYPTTTGWVCI